MSWDQQAYSFGGQPPTPQTPRNKSSFEEKGGWTPQLFAEEYSVFNSTPGRLTNSHPTFIETPRPSTATAGNLDQSTTEDIAAEFSIHVHHLSPNPAPQFHPVDPSAQLPSSPGLQYPLQNKIGGESPTKTPQKPRRFEDSFGSQTSQTATPPASQSKGTRKLAPKLSTEAMQNDPQNGHYGMSHTPTHQTNSMSFQTSTGDFLSYPMSAPVYDNTKSFWDTDVSMNVMDLDFPTDDTAMFNMDSHKVDNSFDWTRNTSSFQETVNAAPMPTHVSPKKEPQAATKRQRQLAPKLPTTASALPRSQSLGFSNTTAAEDPFSATATSGVNPGALGRGTTVPVPANFADAARPAIRPATSHTELKPYQHQSRESKRDLEELQRARSSRDGGRARRLDRGTISSPVKSSARPGLQRSFSENRGRRVQDRVASRAGRVSPIKAQRIGGLMPIPELPSRVRTEVKFTIDANGRARTETVVIADEPKTTRGGPSSMHEDWDSSHCESSSDDEPIIVPSRKLSFTLPQAGRPSKQDRIDTTSRRLDSRRHSTGRYSQSESSSQRSYGRDSYESEAETVVDEDGSGDATQELRRLMESRKQNQRKVLDPRRRYVSDATPRGNTHYNYYGSSTNLSPTTLTDPATTPSSTRSGTTRCVCNNPDSEGFMIQCEACENWLHTECVGIDRRSLPPVYVCAFCAQTPNRGGRLSHTRKGSSPLAHKSFRSFR